MEKEENKRDDFLLRDHGEIWQVVRKITDERNGWLKFYWSILTASLTALAYLHEHLSNSDRIFWKVSTTIFFVLTIISSVILMILFSLRTKSVEYRNHLNRIRGTLITRKGLLKNYLSTSAEQRFLTKKFGVENSILWIISATASLILGAFVFSLIHLVKSCCPGIFEHRYCISVIAIFLSGLLCFVLIIWRGCSFDKEMEKKEREDIKNMNQEQKETQP